MKTTVYRDIFGHKPPFQSTPATQLRSLSGMECLEKTAKVYMFSVYIMMNNSILKR